LPSVIQRPGRIATTTDSLALTQRLAEIAREAARTAGPVPADPAQWPRYVDAVLTTLQRRP
jgi:hypothetical protein